MKRATLLYDAVFGGPGLKPALLQEVIREAKIALPSLVYAVEHGKGLEGLFSAHYLREQGVLEGKDAVRRVIHLPPAGSFWFLSAGKAAEGRRYRVASAEMLVLAMQQAVLEQRRRDLELLKAGPGRTFSHQEEMEAYALALQEARRDGAGEAVRIWSRVVLLRHHHQINAVRLRWVEFLTALTRGSEANLAYTCYALIRMIYREHALPALEKLPGRIVAELRPLLAGRERAGTARHPVMPRAFEYMEAHFAEGIGLAEVAAATHTSPAHLARIFRQETGQTVVSYLQRLRVQRARELLGTTEKPLLEVALDSGFESVEHFHRLFRRHCGVTPRTYRLTHR